MVSRKDRWRGWGSVSPDRAALAALTPVLSSRRIFPVLTRRHTLGPVPCQCAGATRKRRGQESPAWNAGKGSSHSPLVYMERSSADPGTGNCFEQWRLVCCDLLFTKTLTTAVTLAYHSRRHGGGLCRKTTHCNIYCTCVRNQQ